MTPHAWHIPGMTAKDKARQGYPHNTVTLPCLTLLSVALDPGSPEPLYLQLASILREQIRSGAYTSGPLPSNRTLRETYDIGEHVVTHALRVLKDEGLIFSVPRRGYYITRN